MSACSEETWHIDECHANVNADVNKYTQKSIYSFSSKGRGQKAHANIRLTATFAVSLVQIAEFQQKINLVQHPTWVNPEVMWLSMSWLN